MKKVLLSVGALLLMQLGAFAQISALPVSQDFTTAFSGDTGTNIAIYPNYTANTVDVASRVFWDQTVYSSAPAAMSIIPTSSFDGDVRVAFNLTNYSNVAVSFVAKSMKNEDGTNPSLIKGGVSLDGGTTWIGQQDIVSLPNEDQASFANYSYSFPADVNNQSSVLFRFFVTTGSGGSGKRAKVVIDDVQFAVTATPQLALGSSALSFNQTVSVASQPQVVTLSGGNLTADAVLTVGTPFEVSLAAASGYGASVTVPQTAGAIASTNIYVRLNAAAAGDYTGTLVATSGASTADTDLTGTVIASIATNPEPFNLASGNYSFTSWAPESAANTYPANMIFWTHATTDPTIDVLFNEDYTCLYSLTSRSRFSGKGDNGVSMINTGNSQFTGACDGSNPTQADGDTVINGRAGAVVLALNTTGRQDVVVAWTGATILKNNRVYGLRLQYRIGAGDANINWTDIANGDVAYTQYTSGEDGTNQTFTTALPAVVNNLPVVEVRWVYNFIDTGVTGSRAEVALDDVTVSSNEFVAGTEGFAANTFAMYPNPATAGVVNFSKPLAVTIYDFTGKAVFTSAKEITSININGLASGIYLVKTANGAAKKLIVK